MIFKQSWCSRIWGRWSSFKDSCRKRWRWNKRFKQNSKLFKDKRKKTGNKMKKSGKRKWINSKEVEERKVTKSYAIFMENSRNFQNIVLNSWAFAFCYTNRKYFCVLLHWWKLIFLLSENFVTSSQLNII